MYLTKLRGDLGKPQKSSSISVPTTKPFIELSDHPFAELFLELYKKVIFPLWFGLYPPHPLLVVPPPLSGRTTS